MSIDVEAVERKLRDYISLEVLLRNAGTLIGRDEDLFDAGFDSLSLTRTLVFIEDQFGIKIPDEEVVVDEVSTIAKMTRFVADRIGAAGR